MPHLERAARTFPDFDDQLRQVSWTGPLADSIRDELAAARLTLHQNLVSLATDLNQKLSSAINPLLEANNAGRASFDLSVGALGEAPLAASGDGVFMSVEEVRAVAGAARSQGRTVEGALQDFNQSLAAIDRADWNMPVRDTLQEYLHRTLMRDATIDDQYTIDGGYAMGLRLVYEKIAGMLETRADEFEQKSRATGDATE